MQRNLTGNPAVGIYTNMQAKLIYHDKKTLASGAIMEAVIWKLPSREPERPHGYKYRLYYGRQGERIIGYDNERGKGDHRHARGEETVYRFSTVDQLLLDFLADVRREERQS